MKLRGWLMVCAGAAIMGVGLASGDVVAVAGGGLVILAAMLLTALLEEEQG